VIPDVEEQIFHRMGQRGDGGEHHHARRTLDGVHDAENLVDVLLREGFRLFRVQQDFLEGLEQLVRFEDEHVQHGFPAGSTVIVHVPVSSNSLSFPGRGRTQSSMLRTRVRRS